jgi:transposase
VSHADPMNTIPDPEVPEQAKRPRSYSARYKAEILPEYETLDREGKARCSGARACRPRCFRSGASSVTEARCRRWPSHRAGRRSTRWSGRPPGGAVGSSSWSASWARPAR